MLFGLEAYVTDSRLLVNMPLIYGEGRKAFMRLQLEILRKTDDDSIYAWTAPLTQSGLLATWPTAFKDAGLICQVSFPHDEVPWLPPEMTAIGLKFTARYERRESREDLVDREHSVHGIREARSLVSDSSVILHCGFLHESSRQPPITQVWAPNIQGKAIVIFIRRFGSTWQRVQCDSLISSYYGNAGVPGSSGSEAYIVYYFKQEGL